jgi:hypothetical protein
MKKLIEQNVGDIFLGGCKKKPFFFDAIALRNGGIKNILRLTPPHLSTTSSYSSPSNFYIYAMTEQAKDGQSTDGGHLL